MSAVLTDVQRCCTICRGSLQGRDPRALTCSPACRRERNRLRRLLDGQSDGPYATHADYIARAPRVRAKRPAGA